MENKLPVMPKATAVWLIENTALTFKQVGDFCGMHELEVQGIADGDVAGGIKAQNPITNQQLEQESLDLAEKDENYSLILSAKSRDNMTQKIKGARYTPIARRQDKPDSIAWVVKNHPYIPDSKIIKLIGTTKATIDKIRDKAHWNMQNIKPKDPVLLGLCSQTLLDSMIEKYAPVQEKDNEGVA